MAQAKRVHSTPRRTASKIKARNKIAKPKATAEEAKPGGSKIIEQCVLYVQLLAAYGAGFSVDRGGDGDYAGTGRHFTRAKQVLLKLNSLSQLKEKAPLSPLELYAKAGVLAAMYGVKDHEHPEKSEQAYIKLFAGDVSDFLAAHHGVQP